MALEKNHTNQQVYNILEDDQLIGNIASVVCVLTQRGAWISGYNEAHGLLTIHYNAYNKTRPVWELDFFEQLFANEHLLAAKDKVAGVFICSERNIVVPDALYDEKEAENWLRKIHFVDVNDVILSKHIPQAKVRYLMAVPVKITELININFKKAATLPLAAYQFLDVQKGAPEIKCCITNEQVCASLYNHRQLQWHKIFSHASAQDIAYNIRHSCEENDVNVSALKITIDTLSGAEYEIAHELSQYFSGAQKSNGKNNGIRWQPAVSLGQQLIKCV
jgi:hypothetical protein